jgi:D-erythrulose 1-phosphate 3-epimerase
MTLTLSLSTNPLINRAADPAELVRLCAEEIGIRHIQLTNEFINPSWPIATQSRLVRRFAAAAARHGLRPTSLMTGAQARQCAMGHPDPGVRQWSEDWFVGFGRIAADLGALAIGSQFAILSWADWDDPARREARIIAALDGWCRVWEAVEPYGVKWLFWEQMSIGREFGHTIAATQELCNRIRTRGIPLKLLLDVDHGDLSSENPRDTDPFEWIRALGRESPILHVKQSSANKGGHWPFVEPFNSQGRIRPAGIVAALQNDGPEDCEICLELSFREREPTDHQALALLRESVAYWMPHVAS